VLAERRLAAGQSAELGALMQDVLHPPIERIGALTVNAFMKKKERDALAAALNTLLASPSLANWRQGSSLDVAEWLKPKSGKTPIVVVSVAHLDDDERTLVLGVLLEEVLSWVRTLPGSQRLRALLVFDEVYGFLPPHPANPPTKRPLVALMKQARAFGVGVLVATQNPMDLDYRALSNAGLWCLGRLQTDADRARARRPGHRARHRRARRRRAAPHPAAPGAPLVRGAQCPRDLAARLAQPAPRHVVLARPDDPRRDPRRAQPQRGVGRRCTMTTLVDVAIGVTLMYLALALVVTTVQELLASALALRSQRLYVVLRDLVTGTVDDGAGGTKPLVQALFEHPLIRNLTDRAPRFVNGKPPWLAHGLPSYIPSRAFAVALIDVLRGTQQPSGAIGAGVLLANARQCLEK
jgi:hypothetical protein